MVSHCIFNCLIPLNYFKRNPVALVSVASTAWASISSRKISNLQPGKIVSDGSNWFILEMDSFNLTSPAELEFSFRDVENTGNKKGMRWDYIELKKMNPAAARPVNNMTAFRAVHVRRVR